MKNNIILVLLLSFAIYLTPAWLDFVPNQLTQPDGTVVDVFYSGDEFHNWAHDENLFTIIQDPQSGFWCWAVSENGDLTSTGFPIHLHTPESLNLNPRENISVEKYQERRSISQQSKTRSDTSISSTGVINSIVVFIRFSDDTEFSTPLSQYEEMFNVKGEGVNSLYQYYYDVSYQQLEVNSPFFPIPNGDLIVSYRSNFPRRHYQEFNANTNPFGYTATNQSEREHTLLRDAISFIANQVPSDLILDSKGDGIIDNVNFVIRGAPGAWATLLWPHQSSLPIWYNARINGKLVRNYNFNIETFLWSSGVSVLAHEFGHSLGLPDLYRYSSQGNPVGQWDLMANNTRPPQSISAYLKERYTDWVPPIPEIQANGTYTLQPLSTSRENHAYKISSPNSQTEYFIVEYRNNTTGLIDSSLDGSGLIFYRINPFVHGNADGPPDGVYIFRPGYVDSGPLDQAFFSLESGRTEINDHTSPRSFLADMSPGGLNISNIGSAGQTISFTAHDIVPSLVADLPYLEDFSQIPPRGWRRMRGTLITNTNLSPLNSNDWTDVMNWNIAPFALDPTHPNGNGARISLIGDNRRDWLVSPEIVLPTTTGYLYLSLDIALTRDDRPTPYLSGHDDIFAIIISPDNGRTWTSNNTMARWDNQGSKRTLNHVSNYGENIILRLSGYSGSVRIGFYAQSTVINAENFFHIDNIKVWHEEVDILPPDTGTLLLGNYPNPFNPETNIYFNLEQTSHVKINIYNIRGQKVKKLFDKTLDMGEHKIPWNGIDDNNKQLSSGVYFYYLKTEGYTAVKKMVLLK